MPQIGEFTREGSGFSGYIRTALLDLSLAIVEAEKIESDNAPDYPIHLDGGDGPEIGAAWKRNGEKAGEYLAFVLDDPSLAQPVRANLFRSGETATWHLQWNRSVRRAEHA